MVQKRTVEFLIKLQGVLTEPLTKVMLAEKLKVSETKLNSLAAQGLLEASAEKVSSVSESGRNSKVKAYIISQKGHEVMREYSASVASKTD